MTTPFDTPILFLVFNRPDVTRIVLDRIKMIKPIKLFVAADGPRLNNESDIQKCKEVKEIIDGIDWDCEVVTLFRESNLGCKYAVSGAISWFFNQVEEGIILEDDILPDISFFNFCNQMLARYRNDERIGHISGFNSAGIWDYHRSDYFFAKLGSIWGWATWSRAWKTYDVNLKKWELTAVKKKVLRMFPEQIRSERRKLYNDVYQNKIDTWDYQWTFSRLINNQLSIIPVRNLINNIGFNEDATHTQSTPEWLPDLYSLPSDFKMNENISLDKKYDLQHLRINTFSAPKKSFAKRLKILWK